MLRFVACLLLFSIPSLILAQKNKHCLSFEDGSVVWGNLQIDFVEVETSYGRLKIPLTEIRSIKMGSRLTDKEKLETDRALVNLSSTLFKVRDAASTQLQVNYRAYDLIKRVGAKSPEVEVQRRSQQVLKALRDKHGDLCDRPNYDLVYTKEFPIKGQLIFSSLRKFQTGSLGTCELDPEMIISIRVMGPATGRIIVDASLPIWKDTGVFLEEFDEVIVAATGLVDLWPATRGQYVVNPKGYSTAGKGGQFMAGALVAKVGDGPEFAIGETFTITKSKGPILLRIVESPWNNLSEGTYNVEIGSKR